MDACVGAEEISPGQKAEGEPENSGNSQAEKFGI